MKLRIISAKRGHEIGMIIEPDMPDVARILIQDGVAEVVEEPQKPKKRTKVITSLATK